MARSLRSGLGSLSRFDYRNWLLFSIGAQKIAQSSGIVGRFREVETANAFAMKMGAALARDVREPLGDIAAPGEAGITKSHAEGLLDKIGPIGAVEDEDHSGFWLLGATDARECSEPTNPGIACRAWRAPDRDRRLQLVSGGKGCQRLAQIMDDDSFRR